MTCQTVQNKVLALPDPRQLPEPLRGHVAGCAACRAWWQQAARLERLVEQLPAPPPPADKKATLIGELTDAGPVIRSVPRAQAAGRPFVSRQVLTYAGGLAAAVLVGVGLWLVVRPSGKPEVAQAPAPRHPLLDKVMQRDLALMRANKPEQKLDILGLLADDLAGETRSLSRAATPDELNELAGLYKQVVNDGLVKQAEGIGPNALTPDQRKALFDRHAARLADTGAEADRAAAEAPPESKPALKRIADAARDGQRKLSKLATEG
ncbi:MAG: hypothetical protein K2P78_09435 [Gemmataceae bacterium]|nr:hypothetical protein [Gemmataceae bacterium]